MKTKLSLIVAFLFSVIVAAQAMPFGHSAFTLTPTSETVTANNGTTGAVLSSDFIGWSDELTDTITINSGDTFALQPCDTALVQIQP